MESKITDNGNGQFTIFKLRFIVGLEGENRVIFFLIMVTNSPNNKAITKTLNFNFVNCLIRYGLPK